MASAVLFHDTFILMSLDVGNFNNLQVEVNNIRITIIILSCRSTGVKDCKYSTVNKIM